jgi:hypothetical protein
MLRGILDAADPANYLHGLAQNCGATMALNTFGMDVADAAHVADMVLGDPYPNPRQPTRVELIAMLHRVLVGAPAMSNPGAYAAARC